MIDTVIGYEYFGRPYVIGEAPGPSAGQPLEGVRRRISTISGLPVALLEDRFRWLNLLDEWPGYGPSGGSRFPADAAEQRADDLMRAVAGGELRTRFIYLGRRVAKAFRFQGAWFVWTDGQTVVPHPSGLSRWWNSEENLARAHAFWQETAHASG